MAYNTFTPIINDGLVFCLDVANNKSYPGSGTLWTNLSKTGANGTLVNTPTYSSDNSGYLTFNGSNQYADCGNTSLGIAAGSTQITMEAWVYPTAFTSYSGIVSRVGGVSPFGGWMLNTNNDGGVNRFDIAMNISGVWRTWVTYGGSFSPALTTNTWYHLVGTHNGSVMALYLNGTLINQFSSVGTIQYAGSLSNLLVGLNGSGSGYFSGRIALVKVYNKTLSSTEVLQNYNATKFRFIG